MMRSLEIGATGMQAQQLNVDVISNNIANMTTTGYKRQLIDFKDLMYQNILRPGAQSSDQNTILPSGLQLGLGVKMNATYRINEQGPIQITNNPLDLALNGNGFFQITQPDGTISYTRSGVFQLNQDGEIVTTQGYRLEPVISVPNNAVSVSINNNGQVFAQLSGQTALQNLGQIQIANFANPAGLEAQGQSLLRETEASGAPLTNNPGTENFATVMQGALENSNVNIVDEITHLISAQRAYEMNSNVIQTSNQMLQTISQLR
jgi:flagellar basal-body rod protein FlgG